MEKEIILFQRRATAGKKMRNIFGDQKYVIAVEKIDSRGKRGIWRRLAEKEKEDHLQKAGLSR